METSSDNTYPVDLKPVDISPYKKGNTGVDYVTTIDSGQPGPHVMISGVVHGNELCGAIALDFLFQSGVKPFCGKLTLGFANPKAYLSFDPSAPTLSRFIDEDFNRLWSQEVLSGPRTSMEIRRAREFCQFITTADFLLDIHSMQDRAPGLIICGPLTKGQRFAKQLGYPEYIVSDKGHASGSRMRDYGDFSNPKSKKNSLLIECGQHWEKQSANVAIDASLRFLKMLEVIDPEHHQTHQIKNVTPQKLIKVAEPITIKSNEFRFVKTFTGFEIIKKKGTTIAWDGDQEILTPFDNCILIMPSKRLFPGQTAVRLGKFNY